MRENLLSKGVLYWGFNTVLPVPWRNAFFLVSKNISHLMMYIPLLLLFFFIFYYFYRILEAILSTVPRLKWRIICIPSSGGPPVCVASKILPIHFFSYLFYLFFISYFLFIYFLLLLIYLFIYFLVMYMKTNINKNKNVSRFSSLRYK